MRNSVECGTRNAECGTGRGRKSEIRNQKSLVEIRNPESEIFLPDRDYTVDFDFVDRLHPAAGPDDLEVVDMRILSQTERDRQFGLRKIAARRHHLSAESLITDAKLGHGTDRVAIAPGTDALDPQPMTTCA